MAVAPSTDDVAALEAQVNAFRETIAPDVYSVPAFVPWDAIDADVEAASEAIAALQELVDRGPVNQGPLEAQLKRNPEIARIARHLFTAPHAVGFVDGRELPEDFDPATDSPREVASLLLDLGLARLVPEGADVAELYRVAAVAIDARKRGPRRRSDVERLVGSLIADALKTVSKRTKAQLTRVAPAEQPLQARGRGLEVVAADERQVAAVATVFQAISGGRQYRDLSVTYPGIQEELDTIPMSLVVIADGRGVLGASQRVLTTLFESVAACLSVAQAEAGGLADAIEAAVLQRGVRSSRRASLRAIIDTRLKRELGVEADELPAPAETAQAALAQYAADRNDLALELSRDNARIEWGRREPVAAAQALSSNTYSPPEAVKLLCTALGLQNVAAVQSQDSELFMMAGDARADPVLPPRLAVASTEEEVNETVVRATARNARQHVTGATIAILVAKDSSDWDTRSEAVRAQRTMATSVVVIDVRRLVEIVGSVRPRDALVQAVLEQADLTKASPFNSRGATPPETFVGRERELANLQSIIVSNSAAVIGGRRIGKTSLLHRVTETLGSEGWLTFYADLQEAGDWETFAEHIRLRWEVEVSHDFAPSHLASIVGQLRARDTGRLVLVFDEIDHLLRWDQDHGGTHVPEAFFRACRALSQEGSAQFVFSGERTIAERLWDPASPHWNFCRPVPLRQLGRDAADRLLERPLASLGVLLQERQASLDLAWERAHGHPQIIQTLGEELVQRLNEHEPADRRVVRSADIAEITERTEYRQHYVVTYWGQATAFEKLVTVLVASGEDTLASLRSGLERYGVASDAAQLRYALQMLDLYGIVAGAEEPLALRAAWLPDAMKALGGVQRLAPELAGT